MSECTNCSNCFDGCVSITSDKCVRYTGEDIVSLGINNGDTLATVEEQLITYLISALDSTGIYPDINPNIICDAVNQFLPTVGEINLKDILIALISTSCLLEEQIISVTERVDNIEADYSIECLADVSPNSGTHVILQTVITKLCEVDANLAALILSLNSTYVQLDELNALIQSYLDSQSVSDKYYLRMVPYTVVEYYGSLSNFDSNGIGIGQWEQIYLCNGQNNTPDKRGRSPIGVTAVPGGGAFSPVVDPSIAGNQTYLLYAVNGANNITLNTTQIPNHTHTPTVLLSDGGHSHFQFTGDVLPEGDTVVTSALQVARARNNSGGLSYNMGPSSLLATLGRTSTNPTGITVSSATNSFTGGNGSHANVHPVIACYYIMYIPN